MLTDPKVQERFANLGGAAIGGSSEQYRKLITDEVTKWGKVIRAANITPA